VEPARVAAIIIEPVQGEGGFYVAPKELMVRLRKLCDEHGIVFIADEIQSGFGRTGKFFAMEHFGVEPDLVTVAKSLAGGFPLAGVVGRAKIMDAPDPGGIGGTYAGNPVACAAALGVFEAFEKEGLMAKAEKQGKTIMERMKAIKAKNKGMPIGDIRGLGAMCAFEVVTEHGGNKPDAAGAKALAAKCLERGSYPHLRRLQRHGPPADAAHRLRHDPQGRPRHSGSGDRRQLISNIGHPRTCSGDPFLLKRRTRAYCTMGCRDKPGNDRMKGNCAL
jgi:4-aminobutyrate aminotransferase-like enzyme